MKTLLILLFFIPLFFSAQNENNKSIKSGWAIQIGTGVIYGGSLGVEVENQISLKEKIRVTPFAGLGFSIGGAPADTLNPEGTWLNYAIGFNLEYGIKHRFFFGPELIGANFITKERPNESINKRMFVGSSFIIGYKGTASFGLIWQIYVGVAHMEKPLMEGKKYFYQPNFGLGIGYKF